MGTEKLSSAPALGEAPLGSDFERHSDLNGFRNPLFATAALVGLLNQAACTTNHYHETVYYELPPSASEGDGEFLPPSACGISPNVEGIQNLTPFHLYGQVGPQAVPTIHLLIEESQWQALNEDTANWGYGGGEDGWIEYEVEEADGDVGAGSIDKPLVTLCITTPDGSETACVDGSTLRSVGGMTRTEWHGAGDGTGEWPSLPTLNLDTNETDRSAKLYDLHTGRRYDNLRFNAGQWTGLSRTATAYELARQMGVPARLTGFVRLSSNVWGLNEEGTGCVSVPYLTVMRDKDGDNCEFFEDDMYPNGDRSCDHGWEGYSLIQGSQMDCEWGDCDADQIDDFAAAVMESAPGPSFVEAVEPFVNRESLLAMIGVEFVMNFGDGIRVGNNTVINCAADREGHCEQSFYPYSWDLAMYPSYNDLYDPISTVFGWEPLTRGWAYDVDACLDLVDIISNQRAVLEDQCDQSVQLTHAFMNENELLRSPDPEVTAALGRFCSDQPVSIDAILEALQLSCLNASDTGFDTAFDTAWGEGSDSALDSSQF